MRRVPLIAAALAALALAPQAAAHVTVSPARVDPGSEPLLTFVLPNESASPVVRLDVTAPEGVDVEQVEAKPGWRIETRGRRVSWIGTLAPGRLATFSLGVSTEGPGRRVFTAHERHANGAVERWRPAVEVSAAPRASRDSGARTLGKAALGVAIAAAVVAAAAGFLALFVWLRGSGD